MGGPVALPQRRGTGMLAVWTYRGIEAREEVTVTAGATTRRTDTIRVQYMLSNRTAQSHDVALRVMLDTLIGDNDGVPFLFAGEAAYEIGQLLGGGDLLRDLFRAVGWAIFGVGIGVAEGVVTFSKKRFLFGGLGGLIGGLVGGIAFTFVTRMSDMQLTNRALGFVLLGAFIGLFVGLIPDWLKTAWLKIVSSGRNEGKEFLLDKPVNAIGSADNCDVGLYGDPAIAREHAEISRQGGQFTLHTKPGQTVLVNNAPATRVVL